MRKIAGILVVLSLICAMAAVSFAQTTKTANTTKTSVNTESIKGKIISINAVKNEIVVKSEKTGVENTITVDPKALPSLKAGEEMHVVFNKETNAAVSLKKIVKKATPAKK